MNRVHYNGYKWLMEHDSKGSIYFAEESYQFIEKHINEKPILDKIYLIPDELIKVCNHGPQCSGLWPSQSDDGCGGKGIVAIFKGTYDV